MHSNIHWLKPEALDYVVYPQLPSFCAVAACSGALSGILGRQLTEQWLHEQYQVGLYTKLQVTVDCPFENFAGQPRVGRGFSNWDVIRLCNAVLLDEGRAPFAALLCGQDLVREATASAGLENLFGWLQHRSHQAIVHLVNHYALLAGLFRPSSNGAQFLLLADSSTRSGPVRSFALAELLGLARQDERYGLVLVSDQLISPGLFSEWTATMTPPEVTGRKRFARIDKKP